MVTKICIDEAKTKNKKPLQHTPELHHPIILMKSIHET